MGEVAIEEDEAAIEGDEEAIEAAEEAIEDSEEEEAGVVQGQLLNLNKELTLQLLETSRPQQFELRQDGKQLLRRTRKNLMFFLRESPTPG